MHADIIIAPVITEKSGKLAENGKLMFLKLVHLLIKSK